MKRVDAATMLLVVIFGNTVFPDFDINDDENPSLETAQPVNPLASDVGGDGSPQKSGTPKKNKRLKEEDEPIEGFHEPIKEPGETGSSIQVFVPVHAHELNGIRWRPIRLRRCVAQVILSGRTR